MLFVIQVLEEDGNISKIEYLIYDSMIENADKCFELFRHYPLEKHSFTKPDSWRDEYHRILQLFEKNLKNQD